jgi:hypothetical protein
MEEEREGRKVKIRKISLRTKLIMDQIELLREIRNVLEAMDEKLEVLANAKQEEEEEIE